MKHYAELVTVATVVQLRKAVSVEPRPEPESTPGPKRRITKIENDDSTTWRITLPKVEAAKFEAGLQSHRDALVAEWKRDRDKADSIDPEDGSAASGTRNPPFLRRHSRSPTVSMRS